MSTAIRGALPIIAVALAGRFGIDVVWTSASTASTEGRNIYLPALPLEGESLRKYVLGYVTHEAAHIRFSDFNCIDFAPDEMLAKALTNIFEDARVECEMCAAFPGVRRYLVELVNSLTADGAYQPLDATGQDVISSLVTVCFAHSHSRVMHYDGWDEISALSIAHLATLIGVAEMNMIEATLRDVEAARSTADCIACARRIVDVLGCGSGPASPADQTLERLGTRRGSLVLELLPEQVLDAVFEAACNGRGTSTMTFPKVYRSTDRVDGRRYLEDVRVWTTALREQIEELLHVPRLSGCERRRSGVRLLRDAGQRLMRGSSKVFRREFEVERVATSIVILLDKSSSMKCRLGLASRVTLALADAFESSDVSVSVVAFPHHDSGVLELKRLNERVQSSAGAIAGVLASGSTPLAGALLFANSELLASDADRRIALTITDGQPDKLSECRDVIEIGTLQGVEYIGIGIETDIAHLMCQSVRVESIDELPMKALALLRSTFEAANQD